MGNLKVPFSSRKQMETGMLNWGRKKAAEETRRTPSTRSTRTKEGAVKTGRAYVSYRHTRSVNYQSNTNEFGFEVDLTGVEDKIGLLRRARNLCEALVKEGLGMSIGRRRVELNNLSQEFFQCDWKEM